ncbi:MAG: hypothetical protein CNIPEHKO_00684 [Anaerolineales bacterium]|nr:hypothetical protein [Anaerolineales bacterium]
MSTKKLFVLFFALSLILSSCGASKPQSYTVGVIVEISWLSPIVDHFKTTMTELGYVEGENITYLYNPEVGPDQAAFDAEAQRLMEQKVDIFFTVGTLTTKAAKKAVEGTDIPVVFTPVINPVEEGIVASIANPGGNVTGVQIVDRSAKALEWALKIAPDTKYVYIPHNPADTITTMVLQGITDSLPQFKVELAPGSEVNSIDEMLAAVETLPEDTIIFLPSPLSSLEPGLEQLSEAAKKQGVPVFGSNRGGSALYLVSDYTVTFAGEAEQGAAMVNRILKGASPAETPVETADSFLFINLNAAQAYGVTISDEIIKQANTIIR